MKQVEKREADTFVSVLLWVYSHTGLSLQMTTWRKRLKHCQEIKKKLKRLLRKLEKQSAKVLRKAPEL